MKTGPEMRFGRGRTLILGRGRPGRTPSEPTCELVGRTWKLSQRPNNGFYSEIIIVHYSRSVFFFFFFY